MRPDSRGPCESRVPDPNRVVVARTRSACVERWPSAVGSRFRAVRVKLTEPSFKLVGGRPIEAAPEQVPETHDAWPGAVYALDFTGHGRSTVPAGGGYTAELLMAKTAAASTTTKRHPGWS